MVGRIIVFIKLLIFFLVCACVGTTKNATWQDEDLSLGGGLEDDQKRLIDFSKLNPDFRHKDMFSRSSFPLPLRVGKGAGYFTSPPAHARRVPFAMKARRINGCIIAIKTGKIEVSRYIKTDRYIKLEGPLQSESLVMIEPDQRVFFSFQTTLHIYLLKATFKRCAYLLFGRKTYLGRLNLAPTTSGIVGTPNSPKIGLKRSEWPKSKSQKVYAVWYKNRTYPVLEAEGGQGVSVFLDSPMFGSKFRRPGSYYLWVKPRLVLEDIKTKPKRQKLKK